MGQQSLTGFAGLHVDLDRILLENLTIPGENCVRKYGWVLINQGDKITKHEKPILVAKNSEKYSLPEDYIKRVKLPTKNEVRIYKLHQVMQARAVLSTGEKIHHLHAIRRRLERKLKVMNKGYRVVDYEYEKPPGNAEI